jgi:hypothetical protein
MQIELCLHPGQQVIAWFEQTDPNDVARPFRPFAGLLDRNARDALAAGVDARGNDTGFASGICDLG